MATSPLLGVRDPSLPQAVIFDCDGVLIESVEIKTRAFVDLFAEHPEHHEAIADHHQANLGISRFEKFRWIHRELLKRDVGEDELAELGRRFAELVAEGTRRCPEVPGTSETLRSLRDLGMPLFVASGTPQSELEELIVARGWQPHFDGVYGSPRAKPEILLSIGRSLGSPPSRMVFVGDGRSDYDAAIETGVAFVLRDTAPQADRFASYRGARITDLEGFVAGLADLIAADPRNRRDSGSRV